MVGMILQIVFPMFVDFLNEQLVSKLYKRDNHSVEIYSRCVSCPVGLASHRRNAFHTFFSEPGFPFVELINLILEFFCLIS